MNNLNWTNPRPCWWEAKGRQADYVIQGVEGSVMWLLTYDHRMPPHRAQQEQKFTGSRANLSALQKLCEERDAAIPINNEELMKAVAGLKIQLPNPIEL